MFFNPVLRVIGMNGMTTSDITARDSIGLDSGLALGTQRKLGTSLQVDPPSPDLILSNLIVEG